MSALQANKKNKTGIPVMKITHRNNESNEANSHIQKSHSDSIESHRSQSQKIQIQQQLCNAKATKKNNFPDTWADEVVESQSQKMRNLSVSESRRRHDDMEKHLKEAEAQLVSMSGLLEQREKMMKEAADEAEKKTTELEQKLLNQDGHLIEHGIDPVTGERITSDEVGERKVESNKKFTKKRVQEMRDKLKQMNNQTESYLSDIENTLQLLNNLELASDRLGRLSEGSLEQFNPALDEAHENILNENHHILTISSVSSITSLPLIDKKAQSENFDNYSVASEGNVDEHFYVPYIRHDDDEEDRDVDGGNITRNDVL